MATIPRVSRSTEQRKKNRYFYTRFVNELCLSSARWRIGQVFHYLEREKCGEISLDKLSDFQAEPHCPARAVELTVNVDAR